MNAPSPKRMQRTRSRVTPLAEERKRRATRRTADAQRWLEGHMRSAQSVMLLVVVCSLASVDLVCAVEHKPTLSIASISPPAGSVIDRSTVLKVVLEYSLEEPTPAASYFVHPLFNGTESGHSFNALKRLNDGLPLKKGAGTIEYAYPIAAEWADPKLAKPVIVTFCVMKQSGARSAKSIVETEPLTYQVSK